MSGELWESTSKNNKSGLYCSSKKFPKPFLYESNTSSSNLYQLHKTCKSTEDENPILESSHNIQLNLSNLINREICKKNTDRYNNKNIWNSSEDKKINSNTIYNNFSLLQIQEQQSYEKSKSFHNLSKWYIFYFFHC